MVVASALFAVVVAVVVIVLFGVSVVFDCAVRESEGTAELCVLLGVMVICGAEEAEPADLLGKVLVAELLIEGEEDVEIAVAADGDVIDEDDELLAEVDGDDGDDDEGCQDLVELE